MSYLQQVIRDHIVYAYGYLSGRSLALPRGLSDVYAWSIAKVTSWISLPLPLLSFLVLPFFGGYSTSFNLLFFYLTWTALLATHDPWTIELYGTLVIRLLCFLLPALGFLAFDCAVPKLSKNVKARRHRHSPLQLGRRKLFEVLGVAVINVLLSVALQAGLEILFTQVLHLRSILRITSFVPLPWNIAQDVLRGLATRAGLHYALHRFVLHKPGSPFATWHLRWQHSVRLPFSLIAAYDHPVSYLLVQWLPTFLPAYIFRFHVLTWHLFLAITSLEELLVYSGYSVLPSRVVLLGMARRTDAHFECVNDGKQVGNFGHLGVLDLIFGTSCKDEVDLVDDFKSEAENHDLQQRIDEAIKTTLTGAEGKQDCNKAGKREGDGEAEDDAEGASSHREDDSNDGPDGPYREEADANASAEDAADGRAQAPRQRRSSRRKGRKTGLVS